MAVQIYTQKSNAWPREAAGAANVGFAGSVA
jgi:hypothetical protein